MSPLNYMGGKHVIRRWILEHLPGLDQAERYVEPFCGAANVFFELHARDRATRRRRGYCINDADGDIVNFFRVLRTRPRALRRRLQATPYAQAEHAAARQADPGDDAVERARKLFIDIRCGMGGRRRSGWGVKKRKNGGDPPSTFRNSVEGLGRFLDALRDAYIGGEDACACIRRWQTPTTLIYCDPPYAGTAQYLMKFTDSDHVRLAEALHASSAAIGLSGYETPMLRELYPAPEWTWNRREVVVVIGAHRGSAGRAVECLITRPAVLHPQDLDKSL